MEYIYRFLDRNNLSLRIPGHLGQILPKDIFNIISNYITSLRGLIKEGEYYEDNNINMDETPINLNMVPNKAITKKCEKNVAILTQNKERIRITCILSICADGDKLPPYIIFKGKSNNPKINNKLKKNLYIQNKKIFVNFNSNAWSTTDIILDWIEKVYNPYIRKDPLLDNALLIMDKASSHISDEIIESCTGSFKDICIWPVSCTNIFPPLDISINKPFKTYIKEKYIRYCISKNTTISKVNKEDIVNWICEVWYDEKLITKSIIYNSFKYSGLSNKIDGSEDWMIKISDFLKNKTDDVNEEDELLINDINNTLENEDIKIKEKLFNLEDEDN